MDNEARTTKHSQGHPRGILGSHSVAVDVKKREMARADKFHRTIVCSSPFDKSRELAGQRTLADNAVGVLDHPIKREASFGETAKCGMEMTHKHRRSHTFAGDIP